MSLYVVLNHYIPDNRTNRKYLFSPVFFELLNYCYANTNFAGEQKSTHFVNLILGPSLLGWASYLKYKNSTYYNLRSLR